MKGDLRAETVRIGELEAYAASPLDEEPRGGVVVIHHLPGYDRESKEHVRRFAAEGYDAVCVNLYTREAPGLEPDDAAALVRAQGGIPDEQVVQDIGAAAAWLRALPTSNGRVGTIGYCSGGRQSFLCAGSLEIQAAVDCYGAFVVGNPPDGWPLKMTSLEHLVPELHCPVLGLFGNDDTYPPPSDMAALSAQLTEAGKEHSFHYFDGAGHAFFSVDRPSYRPEAAKEGWKLLLDFFGKELA